ncbi:MAG: hypothetical protein ACLGJB_03710 [Blastocatellia bacterium]
MPTPNVGGFLDGSQYNLDTGQQVSPAITPEDLTKQTPIVLPTVPSSSNPDAFVSSIENTPKTLNDYIKELTPQDTPLDATQNAIIQRITDLLPQSGGKSQALAQEQQNQGIPQLKQQLTDINNQILTGNAEYQKMIADYNQNSVSLDTQTGVSNRGVLAVQQGSLARIFETQKASKAADLGLLAARAQAVTGNINTAIQLAQSAVDARYAPIEDELKIRQAQLESIQPLLNKQEKQQALAQQQYLDDRKEKIAEEKAKRKANLELAFSSGLKNSFINKNGEFFRASDGKPYGDPKEFFKDAGVSSFEEAYRKGLVGDLTSNALADRDFIAKLRVEYPDAGITINDSIESATRKLSNSAKYQKETLIKTDKDTGFTLQAGEKRYDANGNLIAEAPPTAKQNIIKVNGKDYMVDDAGNLTEPQVPAGEMSELKTNALEKAKSLLERLNKGDGALGKQRLVGGQHIPGTSHYSFDVDADNLKSLLSLDNVKLLKGQGQVSDAERELLEKASSRLNLKLSRNDFKAALEDTIKGLSGSGGGGNLQWKDPNSGQLYQFPDQDSLNQFKKDNGISFNSVGNTTASTKTLASATMKIAPPGSQGGQCGVFVRNIASRLGLTYPKLGDYLSTKTAAVRKYGIPLNQARVGSILVTSENKENGHVAWIIGKNDKGFILAESNRYPKSKPEQVSYGRVIPFNSPSIIGAINPYPKNNSI